MSRQYGKHEAAHATTGLQSDPVFHSHFTQNHSSWTFRIWHSFALVTHSTPPRGSKPGNERGALSWSHVDDRQYRSVDSHGMGKPSDLLQGTLDLLILRVIAQGPMHGWAIAKRIEQISNEVLLVQQGSLYPALHRLERQGWIKAEWAASENNRRAKYYELTRTGRKRLESEVRAWRRLTGVIDRVLDMA